MKYDIELDDLYQEIILDHYRKPRGRCTGEPEKGERCVHHSNPLCGDELTLRVKLDDGEQIKKVCFSGQGCAISQASASMMTEAVKGLNTLQANELVETVRQMMKGKDPVEDIGDIEALEGVAQFPVRIKCALLAWMALKDALANENLTAEVSYGHD